MEITKSKPVAVKVVRVQNVGDRTPNPFWFNPAYLLGTGATNPFVVQSQLDFILLGQEGVQYDSRGRKIQEPASPQYFNYQA